MLINFGKKDKKQKKADPSRVVIYGEYLLQNIDEDILLARKKALLDFLQNDGFSFIGIEGFISKLDLKTNIFRFYKTSLLKPNITITISDRIQACFKNMASNEVAFLNTISQTRLDLPADITIRFIPLSPKKDGNFDVKVEIEIYPVIYLKLAHIEAYQDDFQPEDSLSSSARSIGLAKNIGASLEGISNNEPHIQNNRRIFIVHGRNETKKAELKDFLKRINTEPIILDEQKRVGKTLLDKFEYYGNSCSFAIILMTGDDFGGLGDFVIPTILSQITDEEAEIKEKNKPIETRARQNVIIEFGYFWGRLGLKKICVLYEDGVKMPSDVLGISYFSLDNLGNWKNKIAEELDDQGIKIDMSLLD